LPPSRMPQTPLRLPPRTSSFVSDPPPPPPLVGSDGPDRPRHTLNDYPGPFSPFRVGVISRVPAGRWHGECVFARQAARPSSQPRVVFLDLARSPRSVAKHVLLRCRVLFLFPRSPRHSLSSLGCPSCISLWACQGGPFLDRGMYEVFFPRPGNASFFLGLLSFETARTPT